MLRQHFNDQSKPDGSFRLRGLDNTRIEALSDGVFALAIALLLISSSAPESFTELQGFLRNFFPFAATITILMLVWYQHYIFFVRYGLKNAGIVALNTLLLFLLLFFVYPLKFLFQVLFDLFIGIAFQDTERMDHLFTVVIKPEETPSLMIIYGFGSMLIFLTMSTMYVIALKMKDKLALSPSEIFDTKSNIYVNLLMAAVPFISALIALLKIGGGGSTTFTLSGMAYMIYPILMPSYGILRGKYSKK